MTHSTAHTTGQFDSSANPTTLPLTLENYQTLIRAGAFIDSRGRIELINGRLVQMNPQGPQHSEPIDVLEEWSHDVVQKKFRIRIEKPLDIPSNQSCPEPNVAWVKRGSYFDRHPVGEEVYLLIEVSDSSAHFDRTEKRDLYANASIGEYWIVDIAGRRVEVYRDPVEGQYRQSSTHSESETLSPLCLPEAKIALSGLFRAASDGQ
jgi:Uma2 family endonuclease